MLNNRLCPECPSGRGLEHGSELERGPLRHRFSRQFFCNGNMLMLNKPRLLTPGPTPLPEEVRLALSRDMVHHRKQDFVRVMEGIQPGLQYLFGTSQQVLPLSCSGTGAMYAAVCMLFSPGERVLVVEGGKFGERWREKIGRAHV